MLSGDSASVDEANTAAGDIANVTAGGAVTAGDSVTVGDAVTAGDAVTVGDSVTVGDAAVLPDAAAESVGGSAGADEASEPSGVAVEPDSISTEDPAESQQAGSEDQAGVEGDALPEGESGSVKPDPMTAWAQSWSTNRDGRDGVVPVTELDLTATPVIDAPGLARVIADLEASITRLGQIQTMSLTNSDRRALLMRTETMTRTLFAYSHTWIADLIDQHGLDGIYGSIPEALAVLLRLSMKQSGQRILMAEQFGERTTLTGERLPPHLPATTHAAENGIIGEEHQQIIRKFFKRLGTKVDTDTAEHAEQQLVQLARDLLPDAFTVAARRLYDILDPDGDLDKESVADRTYLYLDDPDAAGLSTGRFRCDAEFRAYLEAAFSKWAKPGMCNPADTTPLIDEPDDEDKATATATATDPSLFDTPTGENDAAEDESEDAEGDGEDAEADADAERAQRDRRGLGRRQHDALKTILRQMLASGQLGQHRGLPVTAVITMTLEQLETATGHAITATGSTIAIRDAIRMATHAHHYLVIFDDRTGRPLHLARTKRLATPDQRIVLIAADRGCTFPGCTRPATYSQTHHIDEWADGGNTDIDTLTFGCDIHHPLVGKTDTDWATTKAEPDHPYPGRTLWHPPTALDPHRHGTINHYHHPHEYIHPSDTPLPNMPLPDTPLPGMPSTQPRTNTPPPDPREPDHREPDHREPGTPEPGAPPA